MSLLPFFCSCPHLGPGLLTRITLFPSFWDGLLTGQSTASLSRSSEFYVEAPNHADLPVFHPEQVTPAAVAQSMALSPRALAAFKAFGLPRSLARQVSGDVLLRSGVHAWSAGY